MKNKITYCGVAAALLLSLSGCGKGGSNVRDVLGLDRSSPDEFSVVSRPPLTVPKEFYLLPPGAGGEKPEESRADFQAKQLIKAETTQLSLPSIEGVESSVAKVDAEQVLGASGANDLSLSIPEPVMLPDAPETAVNAVSSADLPSSAEESLLGRVGANAADPKIRSKLKKEAWENQQAEENKSVWDALKGDKTIKDEAVVDAPEEAERIIANKEEGKAINEGDVELDDPADRSAWQRMKSWF